tara:strand:+ start:2459 stop:3646 length:1188 start_codon:yes stop_codon:yes gene_type:complete
LFFQTLDDKSDCVGVYVDGEIILDGLPKDLSHTWSCSGFLKGKNIQYAKIYCGGKSLDEVCPEHLTARWNQICTKLRAFMRSFKVADVSLEENCFFDLVPRRFLLEYCYLKDQICKHVFSTFARPPSYDFQVALAECLGEMRYKSLSINSKNLFPLLHEPRARRFLKNLNKTLASCKLNPFGTKTGRLTTEPGSFPILTMDRKYRCVVEPTNDFFIELDFNAAELRTLISLQGKNQPPEDIHEWNVKNVYRGLVTREEAKKRIFAWLYNPESTDYLSARAYDRDSVVQKYFTQGQVTTFWSKIIPSEERTALNYIIQSTCAENVLRQMLRVSNYLEGKESFVAFPVHDSIIIDLKFEERYLLPNIIKIFGDTLLGEFLVNVRAGKDFGNLKKLKL